MPFRFMQLADPQFGMFREFSAMAPDRRQELYRRLRPAFLPPGVEPDVPDGVTDLTPELQRFGAAIETANAERPRFVVVCGDLVNNVDRPDQWEALADTATGLDDDIPMRWLPGNHDLAEDFTVPTPDGLSAYRARFGDDYYAFQEDNVLFLALNSETLSRPDHMPLEADRQFEFLADTLRSRGRARRRTSWRSRTRRCSWPIPRPTGPVRSASTIACACSSSSANTPSVGSSLGTCTKTARWRCRGAAGRERARWGCRSWGGPAIASSGCRTAPSPIGDLPPEN